MSDKPRFSRAGPPDSGAAMASLALWRALVHHLVETKRLHPDEVELIRRDALGEFPVSSDDAAIVEAKALIEAEFP